MKQVNFGREPAPVLEFKPSKAKYPSKLCGKQILKCGICGASAYHMTIEGSLICVGCHNEIEDAINYDKS